MSFTIVRARQTSLGTPLGQMGKQSHAGAIRPGPCTILWFRFWILSERSVTLNFSLASHLPFGVII